jgi:hypothetical protein
MYPRSMRGLVSLPHRQPANLARLEHPLRVLNRRQLPDNRRQPKAFRRHPLAEFSSRVPHSE